MMEKNNDIFLTGHTSAQKIYHNTCLGPSIYLVRTFLMIDFSIPLPLYSPVHILGDLPLHYPSCAVLNEWPISQPKK